MNNKIKQKINPVNWQLFKLGEVVHVIRGISFPSSAKSSNKSKGKIAVLRTANIQKEVDWGNLWFVDEKYLSRKEQEIKINDILISNSNSLELLGKVALVRKVLERATLGTFITMFRVPDTINPKFIYYQLSTAEFQNAIKSRASTTTNISNISVGKMKDILVKLAPINIQNLIVSKIEQLFSEIDKGIESLKAAQQQLKVYRQAVLKWAFEGKLTNENVKDGELPKGWKLVKLEEVSCLITKGASPKWQGFNYISDDNQLLFITSENVRENFIDISNPKYLSSRFNEKQKRSILKRGDVLFNLVGASIGRAAIFNLEKISNINQAVAIIRLKDFVVNNYISLYLNSEKAKQKYLKNIVDVARANLSLTDTSNIEIPLTTLEEQTRIVQEIENRFMVICKLEEKIKQNLEQAEALKQSILKRAFEGKLV